MKLAIYRYWNNLGFTYEQNKDTIWVVEVTESELDKLQNDTLDKVNILLNDILYKNYWIKIDYGTNKLRLSWRNG